MKGKHIRIEGREYEIVHTEDVDGYPGRRAFWLRHTRTKRMAHAVLYEIGVWSKVVIMPPGCFIRVNNRRIAATI